MRRPILLALAVTAGLSAATASHASPRAFRYAHAILATHGSITIPNEWDGVWASEDSVYDCSGNLQYVETYLDTLCAGAVVSFEDDDPTGGLLTIDCTGSASATTVDILCTGSGEIVTDCTVTLIVDLEGTRTGDSFVATSVTSVTYDGTGTGCDIFPDDCTRVVTHADRIGPAPAVYCATPVRTATWGEVKLRYR
jgi:hypothetical protein